MTSSFLGHNFTQDAIMGFTRPYDQLMILFSDVRHFPARHSSDVKDFRAQVTRARVSFPAIDAIVQMYLPYLKNKYRLPANHSNYCMRPHAQKLRIDCFLGGDKYVSSQGEKTCQRSTSVHVTNAFASYSVGSLRSVARLTQFPEKTNHSGSFWIGGIY